MLLSKCVPQPKIAKNYWRFDDLCSHRFWQIHPLDGRTDGQKSDKGAMAFHAVARKNIIIRRNRFCSANDSAYCYTFLRSVLCLSVVCYIRASISGPSGKGESSGSSPQAIANCSQTISSTCMLLLGKYKREERLRFLPNYLYFCFYLFILIK